jgi:hypothetical protein
VRTLWGIYKIAEVSRGARQEERESLGREQVKEAKVSFYSHQRQLRNLLSIYIYTV